LINIMFAATAFVLWFIQKSGYQYWNSRNVATVSRLSETDLAIEENLRESKGNKSPLFTFTT